MKSIENRLIVRFNESRSIAGFRERNPYLEVNKLHHIEQTEEDAFAKRSLTPEEQNLLNTVVITSGDMEYLPNLYEQLSRNPAVDYVQFDQEYELFAKIPPQKINDWWFTAINYKKDLMSYVPVNSIRVAVIDTGIDHAHIDLDPASFVNPNHRRDFTNLLWLNGVLTNPTGDAIPASQNGYSKSHGTHVAGIIAALYNKTHTVGIANMAPLMNLRAYPNANESILSVALNYAIQKNARVINASWGTKITPSNPQVGSALKDVIDYACSKGIVVICAAGDNKADVKDYVPACFNNVIAVGSVDKPLQKNVFIKAETSNDGQKVISAPGVKIASLTAGDNNHMLVDSGTSMSAAFLSGLVARMLDKEPNLGKPSAPGACNVAADILRYIRTRPVQGSVGMGMIDVEATLKNLPHIP
ncbi:MAG TPA: S8 family serine peptidase [Saprospiraceae bacterium]|nr:S8 family serine peptidase [Saprospiraceae bacterium]HPI06568.1 S8 family serine peptidase [Saprospiraceae bacterium]